MKNSSLSITRADPRFIFVCEFSTSGGGARQAIRRLEKKDGGLRLPEGVLQDDPPRPGARIAPNLAVLVTID
jgi:hypothetical protein